MNPSYSLYPSQLVPQPGLYPIQPTLPTVTAASTPSQIIFNIGHPMQPCSSPQPAASAPQPDIYPPQPAYAPQPTAYLPQPSYAPPPSYSLEQPAPFYPSQPSLAIYHPAPVPPYPSVAEKSYPTPAVPYPPTEGSTYPAHPNQSRSSYHTACAPPSSAPSSSPYLSLIPYFVSNPKQDSGAGEKSSANPSQNKSHSRDSNVAQQSPTVRPVTPFNPQADAQILRRAIKSQLIGVDKKSVINVLTARSNNQRLEIAFHYKNMYDKSFITALKMEFTVAGFFLDLMTALLKPLPEFLASEVHQAIAGWGSNEKTLVEILCTASNVELDAIRAEYKKLYYRPLEKDLARESCGNFEHLLASMVQVRRTENGIIDETAVVQDAQSLVTAGVLRLDIAESSFVSILCTRSYDHLRHVFKVYEQISGKPLEYTVSSQFAGVMKTGLLAIIHCVEDKAGFFADRIYDAVSSSSGIKDRNLIRVIVSRSEIDLQTIKETYRKRYGKQMELDISKATDGNFKKTLLALIGGYY